MICHKMAVWDRSTRSQRRRFLPVVVFSFHTHVHVVNLKGGFRSFSFSAARQWFSVHLNHVQIVTELVRSLSRAAITAWGLTYERILMIRLCSNVSSEKSKCSSSSMVFFILALMASNDEFFAAQRVTNF